MTVVNGTDMKTDHRFVLSVTAVLIGAIALTGCSGETSSGPAASDTTAQDASASPTAAPIRRVSLFDIRPGDCMNMTDVLEGVEAELIDCDLDHDAEVFAETTMTDVQFPGAEAAVAQAETFCMDSFQTYVGVGYPDSALEIYYFTPTEQTWAELDDRLITCIVYDTEPYQGTLEGTGR